MLLLLYPIAAATVQSALKISTCSTPMHAPSSPLLPDSWTICAATLAAFLLSFLIYASNINKMVVIIILVYLQSYLLIFLILFFQLKRKLDKEDKRKKTKGIHVFLIVRYEPRCSVCISGWICLLWVSDKNVFVSFVCKISFQPPLMEKISVCKHDCT